VLYGGTFDPVHIGHIEVATRISKLFEIDELLFLPAKLAPHKLTQEVTPAIHRFAMLVLGTQHDERLLVETYELDAPDRRYTVDTVAHFEAELGASADLFFLMGADSWSEITTWKEWQRLLTLSNHIVVTRPGYEVRLDAVGSDVEVVDLRGASKIPDLGETVNKRVFVTDEVMTEIAATEIRGAARDERFAQLAGLVPEAVAEYIIKYKLYRETNES
ncbi:MAG: nicotinate-nucleotide adenylyltransferase, partial [Acidobacteriota bacterium]